MNGVSLYICDPAKNTICNKRGCRRNPNNNLPTCYRTKHVEFSVDGCVVDNVLLPDDYIRGRPPKAENRD